MENIKKPLIGLTSSHNIHTDEVSLSPYCPRAILAAGGIPVILPLEASEEDLKCLAAELDGFLFTGGPDPHPFLFGEETRMGCGEASVKRDRMELALLKLVMEQRKPVMGICRGIQIINVGLGGTIYQDIPSQTERVFPIAHQQPFPHRVPSHTVQVTAGSLLERICRGADKAAGPTNLDPEHAAASHLILRVNSTHHQAVRDAAPGLSVCAYAPDGIIEGVIMEGYPYLVAVQWHPEYLWEDDPAAARLFQAFVAASSGILP